jgi:transcriptional regulator with PAS, ATPase and Fis domain
MEKKTITLVAEKKHTLISLVEQCNELGIAEDFHLEARLVEQLPYNPIPEHSLVVLSSMFIKSMVESYLPANSTCLIGKRTIRYSRIRDLLSIPKGTKVLLVNDIKESTEETITLLKESGIRLEFYPYYPGIEYRKNIKIAITPGEVALVPPGVQKVIDIGSRVFDLSTWIDIYSQIHHKNYDITKLTARYVQSLVSITEEFSNEIQRTTLLQKYLKAIVEQIEDAVIAVDQEGIIRITNHKAYDALHLHGVELVNRSASECLPIYFYKLFRDLEDEKEHLVDWENRTYFLRKTPIVVENKIFGYLVLFREAAEIEKLEHNYRAKLLSKGLIAKYTFEDICCKSSSFQKVVQIARKVASSNSTVLLLGETGTGKELLAQAIHNASPRRWSSFVGVNFAAISESLLESELFGYEEGAFTGARKGGHIGLFEQAHKGTIFLDEIGDASHAIQNRLLRVLQERQVMRLGGTRVIPIDIRVIAATNQNLDQMVQEGTFRADLYYRLNVLPIHLPPLRHRREDIPWLINRFIRKFCVELKRPLFTVSNEGIKEMMNYHWPGNIRELENVIEYLAHVVEDIAYPYHLPFKQEKVSFIPTEEMMAREFEEVYLSYKEKGFLDEIISILKLFNTWNRSGGRYSLMEQLQYQGISLSEQQLRYRLKLLHQDELLDVGRGRRGSTITPKGKHFLHFAENVNQHSAQTIRAEG